MRKPIKRKKPVYKYHTAMLIDDNELDNFINQKIIESSLFAEKVYVNTGGASALEFLKNLLVTEDLLNVLIPDIIFIDINMPLMDGFQFIDEYIKLPESLKNKTKLVILTTSINPQDRNMASRYGNKVNFINKPLNEESLANI
jgi:CheY-like chemotaxis protein